MNRAARITIALCFLLLNGPPEGRRVAIITPGDRNEDTAAAHCVFPPKAPGGPHAGRPLLRSKHVCWSSFLARGRSTPAVPFDWGL